MNSDLNIDEIAKALSELGISVTDAEGNYRALIDILRDVSLAARETYMFSKQNRAYDAANSIASAIENQRTEDFFNGYNKFLKEVTGSELDDFLDSFLITDIKEVMPNE